MQPQDHIVITLLKVKDRTSNAARENKVTLYGVSSINFTSGIMGTRRQWEEIQSAEEKSISKESLYPMKLPFKTLGKLRHSRK